MQNDNGGFASYLPRSYPWLEGRWMNLETLHTTHQTLLFLYYICLLAIYIDESILFILYDKLEHPSDGRLSNATQGTIVKKMKLLTWCNVNFVLLLMRQNIMNGLGLIDCKSSKCLCNASSWIAHNSYSALDDPNNYYP